MRSRWIVNLLLLGAIAALALVAWYEPGLNETSEPQALSTLQQDQIDHIRIVREGRDDLVMSREANGQWSIEHQPALPADAAQLAALTRLATQKPERSYPAHELDLARLGLEPPRSTVILNQTRFAFGGTEPLEELRYVRHGERVHLIPDIYQYLIDADFTRFVRRRLLPDQAALASLRLPDVMLERVDGTWRIEPEQEAGADRIQRLIDNWREASALSIKAAGPAAEGEPVTIGLHDPERELRFVVTAREPELVLVRPDLGIAYHMGDAGQRLLALPAPVSPAGE